MRGDGGRGGKGNSWRPRGQGADGPGGRETEVLGGAEGLGEPRAWGSKGPRGPAVKGSGHMGVMQDGGKLGGPMAMS